jgi:hypothetical protein
MVPGVTGCRDERNEIPRETFVGLPLHRRNSFMLDSNPYRRQKDRDNLAEGCARLEFPADSAATFGPGRFRPGRGGLESAGPALGAYRTFGRPPATSQFDPEQTLAQGTKNDSSAPIVTVQLVTIGLRSGRSAKLDMGQGRAKRGRRSRLRTY